VKRVLGAVLLVALIAACSNGIAQLSTAPVPSPSPRVIATDEATWAVTCGGTSDADCDGAVGLFTNNLARSW
jgi:hypothetical protein